MIKTYEGFFDLFKKKKDILSKEQDIRDCLYDLIDDSVSFHLKKSDSGFLPKDGVGHFGFNLYSRPKKTINTLLYGFKMKGISDSYLQNCLLEIKGHVSEIDPDIRLFYIKEFSRKSIDYLVYGGEYFQNWIVIGFSYEDEVKRLNDYVRKNPDDCNWCNHNLVEIK